jgi:Fic family protein
MPGRLVQRNWQYNPTSNVPAKYQRACRYDAFIPDPLMAAFPTLDATVAGLLSEAEQAIRALNIKGGPELAPLARLLLRTESIASSKVEGLQMDVRELARAEAKVDAGMKTGATAREILANIDAMVLAVDDAALATTFGIGEIVAIHSRLMVAAENARIAGRVRTDQNWIGGNDYNPCGADFVPPPPEEVERLMADLCEFINDRRLPPLVQAALVHAQFETIHPFADGNGRTGRALIHVILRRRDVAPRYLPPISVVLAAAKGRYIEGLTRFRGDGTGVWLEHFAGAAARAAHLADMYLQAAAALGDRWRTSLARSPGAPRSGAAAWAVLDILPAHPIITPPVATALTGRAKGRIYEAFQQLENAGVLVPLSQSHRNRAWEVVGLLELMEGLEAGQLPTERDASSNEDRVK